MPGYFTDYANNAILDLVFGSTTFPIPPTLYLGLSQGTSNKSGLVTEPSAYGYTRVAVANTLANFPRAISGAKTNADVISFPAPTGSWGTVYTLFIADAPTGGNILAMADLTNPTTIDVGCQAASIAAGALFVSHT